MTLGNNKKERDKNTLHIGHRDRVRRRFVNEGIASFDDHIALEMLLYYSIPQKDTNELAHELLNHFGSLAGVFDASVESLESVKGVGRNTAVLIKLIPAMYSKYLESKCPKEKIILDSSEKSGEYFVSQLLCYANEVLVASFLDSQLCVKNTVVVSEGTSSKLAIPYRKIVNYALNYNTPNIIIAHNHPSGIAAPSTDDIDAVRQLNQTLNKLNLKLRDSIIVAGNNYYSMAEHSKFRHLFV